jgi:hypothetical protein
MGMILAIAGEEKTCKTTLALSAPKKILHMDFDVGGFRRASHRFIEQIKTGVLESRPYYPPQQAIRDKLLRGTREATQHRSAGKVIGYKDLWYRMLEDYVSALEGTEYETIIMDSFVQVWEICRLCFLEEKQERDPKRESLLQIEYGEPNARMRALILAARQVDKNLILIHHMTDKREARLVDGKKEDFVVGRIPAGWGYIGHQSRRKMGCWFRMERLHFLAWPWSW